MQHQEVYQSDENLVSWLNALSETLRPFNAGPMKSYPVSTRVNAPKNDDPECAAEIALQGATDRAEQLLPGVLLP